MNKTILKNFAVESRKDLMEKMRRKISLYYIDEKFDKSINGDIVVLSNDKHSITLTKEQSENRDNLVRRVNELGIEQVIEESAYTWFNRLVAIRYMEINDYLPLTKDNQSLGFRVLSSQDNTLDPEILKFTNLSNTSLDIDFNSNKYSNLTNTDEKFKYVLLLVCKKLGKVIPQVFDGITDYIDLLIPDNLLSNGSVLDKLIKIPENNFKEVEVIGWLYQYYISIKHDEVISPLYGTSIKKNDIPAATQLFTPDWIVKYMVENSLGKFYIEHNGISDIINNWEYFIKDNVNVLDEKINILNVKCMDPCSGSGHILVYMFEVLYQIYLNEGYSKQDIPELILKNNLYGLDIDDRAGQLSILSIILKAREYDRNIFNKDILKNLNIMSIQESNNITVDNINYLISGDNTDSSIGETINYLIDTFKDAKEIGSLLLVNNNNYKVIIDKISMLKNNQQNILDMVNAVEVEDKVLPLLKEAILLSNKYDIVVTNPPYMSKIGGELKSFLNKNYKDYSQDLFSSFMYRNINFINKNGLTAFLTPNVWMAIKSYEELRKYIITNCSVSSLVQLSHGSFNEIACVDVCSFIITKEKNSKGNYIKLSDISGDLNSQRVAFLNTIKNNDDEHLFKIDTKSISSVPGYPFTAFSFSKKILNCFSAGKLLQDVAFPKQGLATSDNNKYLRLWYEVKNNNIYFDCKSHDESLESMKKWYPYNKGGIFRKWYGNNDYVVNWFHDGEEIKNIRDEKGRIASRPQNLNYFFKESISWSLISSYTISFRYKPIGHIFDIAGMSCFEGSDIPLMYLLGLNNSSIIGKIMLALAPTINYQVGNIANIPVIYDKNVSNNVINLVKENIDISKNDWDLYETSWDFKKNDLLLYNDINIENSYKKLKNYCNSMFLKLSKNEEELNRIFIKLYNLEGEVDVNTNPRDISVTSYYDNKTDIPKEIIESYYVRTKEMCIKSFISYAVGCMFGRYSLDEEGLIYAGGEWDKSKYKTFIPDNDNIIPIADNNDIFYSDDIVGKFIKFVEITFGKDTLRENLDYIAETLGKKGIETSEETIRRYFLNDFYKDHLQTYQKRPIYWMFDSGKSNGFKCLIYMHRYNEQTISKIKVDYFLKVQESYRNQLAAVQERLNGVNGLTTAEIKELRNKEKDLTDKLKECKDYYEKLDHIANEMIKIDLDDGVKVNYAKFEDILAKVK